MADIPNPTNPWRIEIGPREIYDTLMQMKSEQSSIHRDVRELQRSHDADRIEAAQKDKELEELKDEVGKMKIKVYGVVLGLAGSAGLLLRAVTTS